MPIAWLALFLHSMSSGVAATGVIVDSVEDEATVDAVEGIIGFSSSPLTISHRPLSIRMYSTSSLQV